jgi:hypothetical protein
MTAEEIAENKKRSLVLAQAVSDNLNRNALAEHAIVDDPGALLDCLPLGIFHRS